MLSEIIPITVCVGYHDLLGITLRQNRKFFDTYVVVTTPEDVLTQEVCRTFHVEVMTSDLLYHHRARFNKSGMIHQAQQKIHAKYPHHWMLMLDADIVLPDAFDQLVDPAALDKECLYSFHRVDYPTYQDFVDGTRPKPYRYDFMGFFQLYWQKDKYYPPHSMACSRCDMQFAHSFPPSRKKILHEDVILRHLGEDSKNWYGRVTPLWEVPLPTLPVQEPTPPVPASAPVVETQPSAQAPAPKKKVIRKVVS